MSKFPLKHIYHVFTTYSRLAVFPSYILDAAQDQNENNSLTSINIGDQSGPER